MIKYIVVKIKDPNDRRKNVVKLLNEDEVKNLLNKAITKFDVRIIYQDGLINNATISKDNNDLYWIDLMGVEDDSGKE